MQENDLEKIKQLLDNAEYNILQVKKLIFSAEISKKAANLASDSQIIEGVFDGENMIAPDNHKFPVAPNYASKSKLVAGDVLKLTINNDGGFVYKQICPTKRKKLIGVLEESGKNRYVVRAGDNQYQVLPASITYFQAQPGNKLTILVPEDKKSEWAAVESILD